jgi:hypothetical protein
MSLELYTSRWANRDLAHLSCLPVSISRGDGRGAAFRYKKVWDLAPSRETFAVEEATEAEQSYRSGLEEIGLERIEGQLQRLHDENGGLPLVLLCHEDVLGKHELCHRRWFAGWYEELTGNLVPELEAGMLSESAEVDQPRLL